MSIHCLTNNGETVIGGIWILLVYNSSLAFEDNMRIIPEV